jgi:hypothetical protein
MAAKFQRVEGVGEATIYRGDPRLPQTNMDAWYQSMLERHSPKVEKRPYLYGSDAGFCARRNTLLEHNTWVDGYVNAAGSAYMAIGVALEDLLAATLKRNDRLLIQSCRLVEIPEIKISGKIDFVVFDSEDQLALIECKTCGELPTEPKPTHLAQIQTYCAVSGVHRAWLTYLSRNLQPKRPLLIRTFQVDCSEESLTNRLATAWLSKLASARRALPPVPATFRKHTECHYCEFRDFFCYQDRPGASGALPTSPLPELEPGELIEMQSLANYNARLLYQDSQERFQRTVEVLYGLDALSAGNRIKLLKILNGIQES